MKVTRFNETPEFKRFTEVMREVIAVPKARLDDLVRKAKENSPRNGDPNAPGQKRVKKPKGKTKVIGPS